MQITLKDWSPWRRKPSFSELPAQPDPTSAVPATVAPALGNTRLSVATTPNLDDPILHAMAQPVEPPHDSIAERVENLDNQTETPFLEPYIPEDDSQMHNQVPYPSDVMENDLRASLEEVDPATSKQEGLGSAVLMHETYKYKII